MPELIFERSDHGRRELHRLPTTQGYPAPTFRPKKGYADPKSGKIEKGQVLLQAADLLAYEYFARTRAVDRTATL